MIAYGIGVLPLIRELWEAHPRVTQPRYADDAGTGGKFEHILDHFNDMQARGPSRGYFPEPTKSILVVDPRNLPRVENFFHGMGVKIVTGSRYLGGFVRYIVAEDIWLAEKVQGWADSVKTLAEVARKHPQSAYTGIQKSLQQEWAFVQRVTPSIGDAFVSVEEAL